MALRRLVEVTFLSETNIPVSLICIPVDFRVIPKSTSKSAHYICGIIGQRTLIEIRVDQMQSITILDTTFDPTLFDDQ